MSGLAVRVLVLGVVHSDQGSGCLVLDLGRPFLSLLLIERQQISLLRIIG